MSFFAAEMLNGIEFTSYNPKFAAQMEITEDIMVEDRNVLKEFRQGKIANASFLIRNLAHYIAWPSPKTLVTQYKNTCPGPSKHQQP